MCWSLDFFEEYIYDLDLEYSHTHNYSISCLYLPGHRLQYIVSEETIVFTFSYRKPNFDLAVKICQGQHTVII